MPRSSRSLRRAGTTDACGDGPTPPDPETKSPLHPLSHRTNLAEREETLNCRAIPPMPASRDHYLCTAIPDSTSYAKRDFHRQLVTSNLAPHSHFVRRLSKQRSQIQPEPEAKADKESAGNPFVRRILALSPLPPGFCRESPANTMIPHGKGVGGAVNK